MEASAMAERLTPLDLLMPRTYIGAAFLFRTTELNATMSKRLQSALDDLCEQLPWLNGRILPVSRDREASKSGKVPGLEIRWDETASAPKIIDKGFIKRSYDTLAEENMPAAAIPADVWPVSNMIDDALFAAGAPVLGASLFRFSDGQGIGLCICLHHNAVDAAGFAEVVRLWVRNMKGAKPLLLSSGSGRFERLCRGLSSHLVSLKEPSFSALIALHPEHSREPPQLPSEFAPCTAKLFRLPMAQIDTVKTRLRDCMHAPPTTNTLVCALIWSSVTRARKERSPETVHQPSRLAMAVNGRRRISAAFSPTEDPYYGNTIVYSLAEIASRDLMETANIRSLARICDIIAQSQSGARIDDRHIAEVCSLVDEVDDYRTLFPGWDLFNSRDLTITSWADLDLYALDFGIGLGKPEFVRMPYVEADGVGIIMPRRRVADEILEVVIMLRRDDMDFLELYNVWECLT
ncbi:hypothetical protein OPT61_g8613 [Boeremia exigua]|uniref:Uncharacterized protein n=1 Tax=Boeremia exigua TaxID=749465 RepID=A0ACC2HXY1_9PLEO|nr:hypothetical protein OPT61_g8613 [Boeremia exigua]